MPRTRLATTLAAVLLPPAVAFASPTYAVGEAVPFTALQLEEAVVLRGDPRVDVRVTRQGNDLLVEVGDARQVVAVNDTDPHGAARVVAMVVVALVGDAASTPAFPPPSAPAPAAGLTLDHEPRATGSPWSIRGTVGFARDDSGTFATPVTGAVSYRLAPFARLVGSVTYTRATAPLRDARFIPLRLGLEGRAGALGVEIGGMAAVHEGCTGSREVGKGGYATGRIYLPVSPRAHVVVEGGGYYMLEQAYGCDGMTTLSGEAYGGHLGGGVEWRL
ncbi:MAG: hypothetical protein SFX73_15635 [Kofleriaceae bacterium]|nr:hypothetical protein [Kofleriaceae bacterium]